MGSYNDIATFLSPMPAHLVRAASVSRGEQVLDVACGTGITAITACRAGAKVTGIDLTAERAIAPYIHENLVRQDYLLTFALKA